MNFKLVQVKVCVIFIVVCPFVCSLSVNEFITLSEQEKQQFDEFKELVSSKLPHDYMRKDIYLLYWLRETDFDVAAAEKMLMNNLEWRKENNIDHIMEEDFDEFDKNIRAYLQGCDKEGRVVLSIAVGELDLRPFILAGKTEKLKRYFDRVVEEAVIRFREMQDDGQKVVQGWVIFDFANFNIATHACLNCISVYLRLLFTLQTRYPGYISKLVGINTPQIAIPLYNTLKSVASPKLKESVQLFGKNQNQWKKYLLDEIDPSQLSKRYGGTRPEGLDTHVFRLAKKVFRCNANFDEYTSHKDYDFYD